jgi:hypothetical protein
LLCVTAFWRGDVALMHDPVDVPLLLALSMALRGKSGVIDSSQMKRGKTGDAPSCLQLPQHPELSTHAGPGSGTLSAAAEHAFTFSAASALSNRCGRHGVKLSLLSWQNSRHLGVHFPLRKVKDGSCNCNKIQSATPSAPHAVHASSIIAFVPQVAPKSQ